MVNVNKKEVEVLKRTVENYKRKRTSISDDDKREYYEHVLPIESKDGTFKHVVVRRPSKYTEEERERFVKAGLALIKRIYDEVVEKYGTTEEKEFWFGNESEV